MKRGGRKTQPLAELVLLCVLIGAMGSCTVKGVRQFNSKAPFVETRGIVSRLECSDHGAYYVKFEVDGKNIQARSRFKNADCRALAVGQDARVWYSAGDPEYVLFVPPADAQGVVDSDIWFTVYAGVVLLSAFALGWKRRQRSAREAA